MARKVGAIQTNVLVSNFVKKTDCNTKIKEVEGKILDHNKCITIQEINELTIENFTARLKQAKLTTKDDIADFVKRHILMKNS